jgi:hypothetical protein
MYADLALAGPCRENQKSVESLQRLGPSRQLVSTRASIIAQLRSGEGSHCLPRLVIWCVTLYWYREIVRDQGDADVHDENHVLVFICVTVVGEEREER